MSDRLEALLAEIWERNLPEIRERIETLEGVVSDPSPERWAEAARAAHALAGSLGTLGRPITGLSAQALEVMLADGPPSDPDQAAELVRRLRLDFESDR